MMILTILFTYIYLVFLVAVYTFLAYIAINFHMSLVQEFGGIVTVLVGNTRKAMTIVLSFIMFPKPGSVYYVVGVILVFGSLIGNAFMKERIYTGRNNGIISKNISFGAGGGGGSL